MKKFIPFVVLAISIITSCSSAKITQPDVIAIEYQAMTRGSNREVVLTKDVLEVRDVTGTSEVSSTIITVEQWNDILKELEKVEVAKMPELKAPTNKRFYDGALIGTLTVRTKDTIYRSSSFDHGNPPSEIANLVNKIVSMSGLDKGRE